MQLGMSKNTVERYLDLLEKGICCLSTQWLQPKSAERDQQEFTLLFIDNGIRNALLNNFNPLELRDDTGLLWENYLIMERLKKQEYLSIAANNYFWRTYNRKEIDFVEERGGHLYGFEMKWTKRRNNPPKEWIDTYSNASYQVISRDNYLEFIV